MTAVTRCKPRLPKILEPFRKATRSPTTKTSRPEAAVKVSSAATTPVICPAPPKVVVLRQIGLEAESAVEIGENTLFSLPVILDRATTNLRELGARVGKGVGLDQIPNSRAVGSLERRFSGPPRLGGIAVLLGIYGHLSNLVELIARGNVVVKPVAVRAHSRGHHVTEPHSDRG